MIEARNIGLPADWPKAAIAWAEANEAVRELWLFGSRAKGTARTDSDVDLGLVLAPIDASGTDWALDRLLRLSRDWRYELQDAIGVWHVSVQPFGRAGEGEPEEIVQIRTYARLLWARS